MYVKLYGAHLLGLEGQIVEVEVDISFGLPAYDIVGLPGTALKESKERVRAAIRNSGFNFPNKRITVNLAPAHIRKEGSFFDLVIALAILIADEQVKVTQTNIDRLHHTLLVGELALDGSTRKCDGIVPLVFTAREKGFSRVVIPAANRGEASSIRGVQSVPIQNLNELVDITLDPAKEKKYTAQMIQQVKNRKSSSDQQEEEEYSFDDIIGQDHVKRAFEVAASGFHHVMMVGPPGSGKTMLAKRFSSLLPPLTDDEAIEVTKIRSVSGGSEAENGIVKQRTFRNPHHSITTTGMMGGGTPVKPGEVTAAHLGVLFLDEFLEFKRHVIESLREPLEDWQVSITRSHHRYTFPAQFLLLIALNPCPCGFYGYETEKNSCTCTATQIERYRQKISGPLYDRLDIQIDVPLMSYNELISSDKGSNTYRTVAMKQRVEEAIRFKKDRSGDHKANGLLTPNEIKKNCILTPSAEELLKMAFEELEFSARGYHKILKLGRTIADLNQTEVIDENAIAEAIRYRSFDRRHR